MDAGREPVTEERLCSLHNCPSEAVRVEEGKVGRWRVRIFYCYEHARALEQGTPLGPLGIDPSRLDVEPVGVSEPRPGGRWEMSPH